jgi:hypothetical protein
VLLTGPFGGLTDDVREFLLCLADEGLPLTGWGDLDPASLRTVRQRLPGGGALGDGPTAWPWPGGGPPCCARCATPAGSPRPRAGCSS